MDNLSGNNQGFNLDSLLGFGQKMVNAYDKGSEIYNSIPFTGDAQNAIEEQQVSPETVAPSPAILHAEQQKQVDDVKKTQTIKSFLTQNQVPLAIGGVAILGLGLTIILLRK